MKIFNSLGSNFSWGVSLRAFFAGKNKTAADRLRDSLAEEYGGRAILTYKGRQALQLAFMESSLPKGARVGINGFTCYVVYQAIERAGYQPVFIDVAPDSLHFDVNGLIASHETKPLEAIVIQNTFGIPCDIASIEQYARKSGMLIVEDLAHSVGGVYADGRKIGSVGDLTMLSFSQDKTLDAVAGGALVDRRHVPAALHVDPLGMRFKLRTYPMLTHLIRSTYPLGVGRIVHKLLSGMRILARPMDDVVATPQQLVTEKLTTWRWEKRDAEYDHRRQIADIYRQYLPTNLQLQATGQPIYVRFPIFVENPRELVGHLRTHGFYFGDTWYDAPAAPKKYLTRTNYQTGQCPAAEYAIKHIINLPTHREMTASKAKELCGVITTWLH